MISSADIPSLLTFEKNLATDNTYVGVVKKHKISDQGFDATKGLGQNTVNDSTLSAFPWQCSGDMRFTFRGQFGNFTTTANSDFGIFLKVDNIESLTHSGYYIRVDNGVAKISRNDSASFTTLSSSALACTADQVVEIIATVIGGFFSVTFENVTANPGVLVTLTATDTTYTTGWAGFRSFTSTVWCRYAKLEQL